MNKKSLIAVMALAIIITLGASAVFAETIGQKKSYSGTIVSIDYSNNSFVLSSKVAWYQQLLGALYPASSVTTAVKIATNQSTNILLKIGSGGYNKTEFSQLKLNDKAVVKATVTDISLSSYPSLTAIASDIRASRPKSNTTAPVSPVTPPSQSIDTTPIIYIKEFKVAGPSGSNQITTLSWSASGITDAELSFVCPFDNAIRLYVKEGNQTATCDKGGLASYRGQKSNTITFMPQGNSSSVAVKFVLSLYKNNIPTGQSKSLSVVFQPTATTGYHNECQKVDPFDADANSLKKCVKVSGSGANQCVVDSDCNVGTINYHNECQNSKCMKVLGQGDSECRWDSDCENLDKATCMAYYAAGGLNLARFLLGGDGIHTTLDQCQKIASDEKNDIRYSVCGNIGVADSETVTIKWGDQVIDSYAANCSAYTMHTVCNSQKCIREMGPGTNQCQTDANCQTPVIKYSCNQNTQSCSSDSNGQYVSLADCQSSCVKPVIKYSCNSSYKCVVSTNGSYVSLSSCQVNCQAPSTKSCSSSFKCVIGATGPYSGIGCQTDSDCSNLPPPPPSETHNECKNSKCVSVDGAGTNQCQADANCQASPTKYSCNSSYQCVSSTSGQYVSLADCQSSCKPASVTAAAPVAATCTFSKSTYRIGEKIEARVCGLNFWSASSWITQKDNAEGAIKCVDQKTAGLNGCVTFGNCLNYASTGIYGTGTFYNRGATYNKTFNCSFQLTN